MLVPRERPPGADSPQGRRGIAQGSSRTPAAAGAIDPVTSGSRGTLRPALVRGEPSRAGLPRSAMYCIRASDAAAISAAVFQVRASNGRVFRPRPAGVMISSSPLFLDDRHGGDLWLMLSDRKDANFSAA